MNRTEYIHDYIFGCGLLRQASSSAFAESGREITVSAAMSLKNGFQEIGKVFEAKQEG